MTWWQWLVAQGLYKDLLGAAVGGIVAPALAWRPLRAHRKRQERIAEGNDKIADLLDTGKPGGLTDVVHAMRPPGRAGR